MVIETPSSSLSFPCLLIFPVAFLDDGGSEEGPSPGPSSTSSSASLAVLEARTPASLSCLLQGQLTLLLVSPVIDQI